MALLIRSITLLGCLLGSLGFPLAEEAQPILAVVEGRFVLNQANGGILPPESLVGQELTVHGYRARITDVSSVPERPQGPIMLYDIDVYQLGSGEWKSWCTPDVDGRTWAIPVTGTWTATGQYVPLPPGQWTLTCTAGAHAKCLRAGYWPWETTPQGASMVPYLQACTRMMRADYCGNGTPHTVPGVIVEPFDRAGMLRLPLQPYGTFEAIWGAEGAVCLQRSRLPDRFPLDELLQSCPRLANRMGTSCNEDMVFSHPDGLLGNRS